MHKDVEQGFKTVKTDLDTGVSDVKENMKEQTKKLDTEIKGGLSNVNEGI